MINKARDALVAKCICILNCIEIVFDWIKSNHTENISDNVLNWLQPYWKYFRQCTESNPTILKIFHVSQSGTEWVTDWLTNCRNCKICYSQLKIQFMTCTGSQEGKCRKGENISRKEELAVKFPQSDILQIPRHSVLSELHSFVTGWKGDPGSRTC